MEEHDTSQEKEPAGNAVEAGGFSTVGLDGEKHEYQFALVIQFKSAEDVRAAIKQGRCTFTMFGE